MNKECGSITVFTGPMFSGKSKALMARLETKQRAHKKVLIIKPDIDDRFGMAGQIVAKKKKAEKFEPDCSMPAHIIRDDGMGLRDLILQEKPDVLGIDEAQFFGVWLGRTLYLWRNATSLEIYVAGLDLDAWAKPFGGMPDILAYADEVHKFTANCFKCGQDARFTQKIGGSSEQKIQVGAENLYEARCGKCWTPPV